MVIISRKMSDNFPVDAIQHFLHQESEDRVISVKGFTLAKCAAINVGIDPDTVEDGIKALLESHKHDFMSIASLLDDNAPIEGEELVEETSEAFKDRCEAYYARLIKACDHSYNYLKYLKMYIYALSTFLRRPIYILTENEVGSLSWLFFPSLFIYEQETSLRDIPKYLTVFMSTGQRKLFYKIVSTNIDALPPRAFGLLSIFERALKVGECEYLHKQTVLTCLESAIITRNTIITEVVTSCRVSGGEIEYRRRKVNLAIIGSSSAGAVGGVLGIVGLALSPVTFGASLGLSIAGAAIGISAGVAGGSARAVEAVKQNMDVNEVKAKLERLSAAEKDVSANLEELEKLFCSSLTTGADMATDGPGISLKGFLAIGSALRVAKSGAAVMMAAVRVSASAAAAAAAVLGPLSLAIDIGFLVEAAYNKSKGDKTAAGDQLINMALLIDMKNKIFNSALRGHCLDDGRVITIIDEVREDNMICHETYTL